MHFITGLIFAADFLLALRLFLKMAIQIFSNIPIKFLIKKADII